MVARIRTGKQIDKVILYNEHKVDAKKACLISSNNFIIDPSLLNRFEKAKLFRKYTSLNQQTKVNALHLSLNFDRSDKLTDERLICIADAYMRRIGFSEQPYLVYKHNDAAHPHIHIVSTNISSDGLRISLHNLGRGPSEMARIAIEKEFGLKKAAGTDRSQTLTASPVTAEKIRYGASSTKQAISNVLSFVLTHYKFCSLPELNAILGLYNVTAERGGKDSLIYKNGGLLYFVINEKGNRVSAPVKASRFSMKPTLKNLEIHFTRNEQLRTPYKAQLKTAIDFALRKNNSKGLSRFIASLSEARVTLLPRFNNLGVIYGLTYIDHRSRCVFNGSDLGKNYSANAVRAFLRLQGVHPNRLQVGERKEFSDYEISPNNEKSLTPVTAPWQMPAIIPRAELSKENVPYPLRKKRRSKKRKQVKL